MVRKPSRYLNKLPVYRRRYNEVIRLYLAHMYGRCGRIRAFFNEIHPGVTLL